MAIKTGTQGPLLFKTGAIYSKSGSTLESLMLAQEDTRGGGGAPCPTAHHLDQRLQRSHCPCDRERKWESRATLQRASGHTHAHFLTIHTKQWEKVWWFLKTLTQNHITASNSAPKYIPKELKPGNSSNHTHTLVYRAALFTTARRRRQPKCLTTDQWRNRPR